VGSLRHILLSLMLFYTFIQAQSPDPVLGSGDPPAAAARDTDRSEYDFPLYDAPFSGIRGGYAFPSMSQSLAVTMDFAQGLHRALARYGAAGRDSRPGTQFYRSLGSLLGEIALIYLPGGYSWLHEEWHRAVLTRRGISSYDGIYDFKILSNAVPVSHVGDEDLVNLKRAHPADMVRLSEAGNEAQIELTRHVRKDLFFNRQESTLEWITLIINTFSPASYLFLCSLPYADQLTDQLQRAEGTDIAKRDIVGMDFTAWVYDLYRPREPYGSRGLHPSGIGINRYIKSSQLTGAEKSYLQLQGILTWLNFINPQLAAKNRFAGKNPFTGETIFWNAALVHELTPFGFTIDCDVMATAGKTGIAATLHSYFNGRRYYPGASMETDDIPLSIFGAKKGFPPVYLSGKAEGWFQPKELLFDELGARAGGALSVCLKAGVTKHLLVSISAFGKTGGWQAGQVSLERQSGAAAGLCLWLPDR
jgi:hypothetical protein